VKTRKRNTNTPQAREVSLARAAMLLGKPRNTLGGFLAEGMPGVSKRGPRGAVEWSIDLAQAHRWLVERAVAAERGRLEAKHVLELERWKRVAEGVGADEPTSRTEALRRRARAQARLAELDLEVRERLLAPVADIREALANTLTGIRQRLLGIPTAIAPSVAAEPAPEVCLQILDAAIREALTDLADEGAAILQHAREREEARA
jgi:phage terminase Nu1 subunit (DNA packaging protein)